MFNRVMLAGITGLILTACTTPHKDNVANTTTTVFDASKYGNQSDFCPKITKDEFQKCTKKGGAMQRQGLAGCYMCTIDYDDAGKVCSGSADCQGSCYNYGEPVPLNVAKQTGQCASNNIPFGCHQTIENGKAENGMLCID